MSKRIFVVEDDALTVTLLKLNIEEMGYQFAGTADNGVSALTQIKQIRPDLVLMDIMLIGEMDGIEVAEKLRADSAIAVIYLTAYADDQILARARLTEPFAYLLKPFSRQELRASIEMGLYKSEMEHRQQRIIDGVVHALTELVRLHDPFLNDMQTRAASLAEIIARELKFNGQEVYAIRLAAMLHAIGLVALPPGMLRRRIPLQGMEKNYFQSYPEISWQMLKEIEFPYPVADMVHQCMERLDGSGFPRGLTGEAMLPGSRVVAVACKLSELLTPHGIDPPTSVEEVRNEMETGKDSLYDGPAVNAWIQLFWQ